MGIGDTIRNAITPDFVKKIEGGLTPPATPAPTPAPVVETTTPQQKAHEAKEKAMNANNPDYVHRAKGGPVKAGGCPMKNVDNSGFKKESF